MCFVFMINLFQKKIIGSCKETQYSKGKENDFTYQEAV